MPPEIKELTTLRLLQLGNCSNSSDILFCRIYHTYDKQLQYFYCIVVFTNALYRCLQSNTTYFCCIREQLANKPTLNPENTVLAALCVRFRSRRVLEVMYEGLWDTATKDSWEMKFIVFPQLLRDRC